MARSAVILALTISVSLAHAQPPDCALQIDATTLEPGEAVDIQLVCTNTGQPGAPEADIPEGLELRLVNAVPATFSQTMVINGRTSQKTTFSFTLRLTAIQAGVYTLGPMTVIADGRPYQTQPVTITVRENQAETVSRGDRYIFADIEVEPMSLYVTGTYRATLTVGIRKVVIDGQTLNMNLLSLIGSGSSLSVFAGERAGASERTLRDSNGVAHRYEIFTVGKTIRAEEIGPQQVGPVFLRMDYPTAVRRGFFTDYEVRRSRKETARAPAVAVEVKGAPEEGRPPSFTGGIGQFTMTVTAKPNRVEQGQPVTLSIAIEGPSAAGVAGPDLAEHPQLTSRFDFSKDELVGDMEGGAKVFRRAIFPKEQGEQTVGPIRWSYFDPQREEYVTLTSEPLPLIVDPPSGVTATLAPLDPNQTELKGTTLTVLTGGISPNYVDAARVLASESFTLTAPWLAALLVPPVGCLLTSAAARHRARLRSEAGYARRRRARATADSTLQVALRNGSPGDQMHTLAAALTGYLADRFNLPPGECTPGDLRAVLEERGYDRALISEVVALLERCDAARYAPRTLEGFAASEAAETIRRWIVTFERDKR